MSELHLDKMVRVCLSREGGRERDKGKEGGREGGAAEGWRDRLSYGGLRVFLAEGSVR